MKRLTTISLIIIFLCFPAYGGFNGYLKADTQVIVTIGPFVDVGDGFTPQTDIALSGDEAELLKHGATAVVDISGSTWAAVTNCRGYYSLTLTTGNTDTEGQLTVIVQDDSDCLPVRNTFMVVNANIFDSLFAAATTDYLQVDTIQVTGTSQTANDNGADINTLITQVGTAGDGLTAINLPNQTMDITGDITGNLSGSVGSITGHTNQTADHTAALTTIDNFLDTEIAAIVVATITNAQGADVATDVAAMIDGSNRVDVGSWLGQAVTLSTGNKPDVNIDEISDDTTAPGNLELTYDGTGYAGGTVVSQADITKVHGTAITETNSGDLAESFSFFFDVDPVTTKTVDDVGGAAGLEVDVTKIHGTAITETSSGNIAGNFSTFWDNADAATANVVDNVGGASGGGSILAVGAGNLGDYKEDATVYFIWRTIDRSGAADTPSTAGTVAVYKNNGTTQVTTPTGISDTRSFDSGDTTAGVHLVIIDTSANSFYTVGQDYSVVLYGAVIDTKTVTSVIATFSIEKRWTEEFWDYEG